MKPRLLFPIKSNKRGYLIAEVLIKLHSRTKLSRNLVIKVTLLLVIVGEWGLWND